MLSVIGIIITFIFFGPSFVNYIKKLVRQNTLLNKIHGPKGYPIIGNLLEAYNDHDCLNELREAKLSFSLFYPWGIFEFEIANNLGFIKDDEIIEDVQTLLADNVDSCYSILSHTNLLISKSKLKGKVYNFLRGWLGNGLLISNGELWQKRRKMLTPAFHFSILKNFIQIFQRETNELVEILYKTNGNIVNVMPLMSQYTLRATAGTAMGSDLQVGSQEVRDYFEGIDELGHIAFYRVIRPILHNNFIFYNFTKKGRLEKEMTKNVSKFIMKIIRQRESNFQRNGEFFVENGKDLQNEAFHKRKLAMLDILLQEKALGNIDYEGIRNEVNTFMFGGYDTSSTALSFVLMELACHDNIQERVYEEISQKSPINENNWSLGELNNLIYMECVIKECLRLYPSVPFIEKILEEEVTTKNGIVLPKGVSIGIHIFDIHRNEKYWREPDKFDPDRFLPENSVDRHPFAFVPFSGGPRNCIGQKFGMLQMKSVLCGILKNFIVKPVDKSENIVFTPHVVLKTTNNTLRIKFVSRHD